MKQREGGKRERERKCLEMDEEKGGLVERVGANWEIRWESEHFES